jgi:LDH2 family malate/lactate/ureidoglycolate dehydrogenase
MTLPNESAKTVYASADAALEFAIGLLAVHDVPVEDARIVARCLVRADLRGVDTHGLIRLPGCLDRVRRKLIDPRAEIRVERVTPAVSSLDGANGFGYLVATRAMAESIASARSFGVGIAGARRSTHFGIAANYVLQAIDAGLIGMVFTNASATMPPWGGHKPILGTSPLAVGAPGGRLGPFVLDMASSVVARGKIRKSLRMQEAIPEGWALDADGRPTTDPAKALQGTILPVGGPKGSGLAMMMDIFSGVLTGAAFGGDVADQFKDFKRPQNVGHFFVALRPDLFVSLDEYKTRMDTLIQRIHDCPPAEGFSEVLVAGEPESRMESMRRERGIPYAASDLITLNEEAAKAGLPALRLLGNSKDDAPAN